MRRTTKLIPPSCLGQQGFRGALQRLSMTLMLMMLTTMTAWATTEAVETYYIDENGTQQNVTATPLTGGGSTTLAEGTYVVNSDIEYTGMITLGGDVNIILGDSKTMTVTNPGTGHSDFAIYGESKKLHIYGQSQGTGALTATTAGDGCAICLEGTNAENLLGIHGGVVTVSVSDEYARGILVNSATETPSIVIDGGKVMVSGGIGDIVCSGGHFDILGGQVTTTGGLFIIDDEYHPDPNDGYNYDIVPSVLTLGCKSADDFISINKITNDQGDPNKVGEVKIASGKTLYDGTGASYNDQTASATLVALTNVTLRNYDYRTVTFDSNGGSDVDAQTVALGNKATEPADPTREGCTFAGWTLNGAGYNFNSEVNNNITLVAKWTVTTYYVDADGTRHDDITATVLTGGETTLAPGTYLVNSNITYTSTLTLGNGEVNIILADGKKMSIGTEGSPIQEKGIYPDYPSQPNLHIYSQTTDTDAAGSIEVYSTGIGISQYTQHGGNVKSASTYQYSPSIEADNHFTLNGGKLTVTSIQHGIKASGNLTINGGILNATTNATNNDYAAIYGSLDVTINSGQVTATATNGAKGIKSVNGDIILGYSRPTDFVQASSYSVGSEKKVKVKDGLKMKYGSDTYEGDLTAEQITDIGGKKLEPASITYYVEFDKNNENASGTMERQTLTYGEQAELNECTFTYEGHALREWTTAADGTGDSYSTDAPFNTVYNLTNVQGAVVTLYAQWGKDIKLCTAEVPDQTLDGSYIYYKFEAANSGNAATGTEVTDGDKVLVVGTDYTFGQVYFYGTTNSCTDEVNKVGDHFTVEIKGKGDYAGKTTADFYIVSPSGSGTWGDLAWSINSDGDFTISLKDGVTEPVAMQETTQGKYDWYSKANGITTITIGEGITKVAANAFAGTSNVNTYGNVTKLTLPSTLTTIGENAFAYCTGLSIDLADLDGIDYPATAFSYIGTITGTLYDKADNSKVIEMMANARTTNVTIKGRTLYKDGNWNTICLPFNVSQYNSLLEGATVKELDLFGYYSDDGVYYSYAASNLRRTGFDAENGTLYLYFKDATADANDNLLKAGTPYLIKWPSGGTDITGDLTFEGVKVIDSPQTFKSEDGNVSFNGTFTPTAIAVNDKSCLFLGVGKNAQNQDVSTLYWPAGSNYTSFPGLDPAADVSHYYLGAFRAYFHVDLNGGANAVRSFNLNFGDEEETTGIISTTNYTNSAGAGWYDLSGRKLQGMPTAKGIYVHNGHKVVIK